MELPEWILENMRDHTLIRMGIYRPWLSPIDYSGNESVTASIVSCQAWGSLDMKHNYDLMVHATYKSRDLRSRPRVSVDCVEADGFADLAERVSELWNTDAEPYSRWQRQTHRVITLDVKGRVPWFAELGIENPLVLQHLARMSAVFIMELPEGDDDVTIAQRRTLMEALTRLISDGNKQLRASIRF